MGKFLKIMGIIFLILIVLIVAGLFFGHSKGDEKMAEFYDIIATNDPNMLLDECSPEIKATIDPPVLKLWMKGFNDTLGKYEGLSGSDFNINYSNKNGKEVLTLKGTAKFAKGQAQTFIEKVNGKITDLSIESPQFKGNSWLTEPPVDSYKAKAIKFLSLLTDNPPKIDQARDMLPPKLQKQLTPAAKKSMMDFLDIYGQRKSIELTGKKFMEVDANGNRSLTLFFKYTGQKSSCDAYVKFAFEKMGSIIYGFLIPSAPTAKIAELFDAIESQNPDEFMKLCFPELKSELDKPILLAWMKAFNKTMGKFESVDNSNFTTREKLVSGNNLLTLDGKVDCSKGPVNLNVRYVNGKIVSFDINSDKLTKSKWFEDVDLSYCKAKGEKYLRYLVNGDADKAGAMMMDKLRKQFSKEQIETAMKNFVAKYGLPEKITVTNTEIQNVSNSKLIKIDYDYVGKTAKCKAYVRFVILGLKTEVIGFKIPI